MAMQKRTPKGTKPNKISQRKLDQKLMRAVKDGKKERVVELLDQGANVNGIVHPGTTALHECLFQRKTEMTLFLIERGAMPTIRNSLGETALHHAASWKNEPLCRLLILRQKQFDKGMILGLCCLKFHESPFMKNIYRNREKLLVPYLKDHTLKSLLSAHDRYTEETAYDDFEITFLKPFGNKVVEEKK